MRVYHGKSVCGGIAIGKVSVYGRPEGRVEQEEAQNQEAEICRYREAAGIALEQLDGLYEKALRQVGEAEASIFEIHRMMLKDSEFQGSIENIIHTLSVNAEYAVARTAENLEQKFQACEDAYMRERAADIKDIARRLLAILQDREEERVQVEEPVILLADDLAPSQTVQLDTSQVLAFVTARGSLNSHTAILARTMGIPALVGTDIPLDESLDGRRCSMWPPTR